MTAGDAKARHLDHSVKMPFPKRGPVNTVADDMVEFYRQLPKEPGAPKDLWVHQGEIVRSYAPPKPGPPSKLRTPDVALQLPAGAGKTLVGGTIAEWRRRKNGERIVYACANKGLARQTSAKLTSYGMANVLLIGSHREWSDADRLRYTTAQAVAVTTYWSIFNSNPPLGDAHVLILDDAHAAEDAVAGPWTITINRDDAAYAPVLDVLEDCLDPLVLHSLRTQAGGQHAKDIHLASAVGVAAKAGELKGVISRAVEARGVDDHTKYAMRLVANHLDQTLVYVSQSSILIRPFVPPTSTLAAFDNATQRIYMSATLGDGGELERAFGRRKIDRLPIPSGWDKRGNGRRFFVFPEVTKDLARQDEAARQDYVKSVISQFGRAVVLAPDTSTMNDFLINWTPDQVSIFRPADVEESLDTFAANPAAVLGLANRYDGLDLPDQACRLVILAGLPARGDLQERFLARSLGAIDVLQERIRARIAQGAGRATRNPNDYAAVMVLDSELISFVGNRDVQEALHPELHAELEFGLQASLENDSAELTRLLTHFLDQDSTWQAADPDITTARDGFTQIAPPGTRELADASADEVAAWQALWQGEWARACDHAKRAVDTIRGSRGPQRYAALWNYLLGSWTTIRAINMPGSVPVSTARAAFTAARAGARGTTWLSHLTSHHDKQAMTDVVTDVDTLDAAAIDQCVTAFDRLRKASVYNDLIDGIKAGLAQTAAPQFEGALVKLGELAGASSSVGDGGGTAKPDAQWDFSGVVWITWEAKSDAEKTTEVDVSSIDQTNRHPRAMADRLSSSIPSGSRSILLTPQIRIDPAAVAIAESHSYLAPVNFVQDLAERLDKAWRTIKSSLTPEAELEEKRQTILRVFKEEQALPTQWLATPRRIRSSDD